MKKVTCISLSILLFFGCKKDEYVDFDRFLGTYKCRTQIYRPDGVNVGGSLWKDTIFNQQLFRFDNDELRLKRLDMVGIGVGDPKPNQDDLLYVSYINKDTLEAATIPPDDPPTFDVNAVLVVVIKDSIYISFERGFRYHNPTFSYRMFGKKI